MNRHTLRVSTLIVVSTLVAILLASALNSFTRVSDSALADTSPTMAPRANAPSSISPAKRDYLPVIFLNSATAGSAWLLSGNAGTDPTSDFLGTTDNVLLTLRVSNTVAFRLAPASGTNTPNVIGGYSGNTIAPGVFGATIGGGGANVYVDGVTPCSTCSNVVSGTFATIGGGYQNTAGYQFVTIGGGFGNTASSSYAFIGGGASNTANGYASTIGGGFQNTANGNNATIGGGVGNTASNSLVTVGGGNFNNASSLYATVGGGYFNTAAGNYATVGGGEYNTASGGNATVGGGYNNTASGYAATVPGGSSGVASGDYSFAAGYKANTNFKNGAFVWADNSTSTVLSATVAYQFLVRASGGITLYTNSAATSGAALYPGSGSWNNLSNKNMKANFANVDSRAVLAQVNALPITTWNYTTQDANIRHIGPMAQDFSAAFHVGENDTTISTVDAQGVALAAVQGLSQENQDLKTQNAQLKEQFTAYQNETNARLATLEQTSSSSASNGFAFNTLPLWAIVGLLALWLVRKRKA